MKPYAKSMLPDMPVTPPVDPAHAAAVAPMRRQYLQIKQRFPDTILLFRLGDFYETFEEDAEKASAALDIVLTARDMGRGVRVPMAGIPHHAADTYIARLVSAGHKVAVCEQLGVPDRERGLVDRDVTRVVTPGTVTDPAVLDSRRNTYVAAVICDGSRAGFAFADLSTGEFAVTQLAGQSPEDAQNAAARELLRIGAVEVVVPMRQQPGDEGNEIMSLPEGLAVSQTEAWQWKPERAAEALKLHFAVESLDGFGLAEMRLATQAAGALLAYLLDTQRSSLVQITSLQTYSADGYMVLDAQARRNLELTESARGERRHGLISIIDETRTPMGARLLRRWLGQPLLDLAAIRSRQDAIERYVSDAIARATLRQSLAKIGDIERVANRALVGTATPRELAGLRTSLEFFAEIAATVSNLPGAPSVDEALPVCNQVRDMLERALPDEPPTSLGNGAGIRPGFSPELDQHDQEVRRARGWIAGLERQERHRTGVRTLKVGYNRASGYYIEISAAALAAAEKDRAGDGAAEVLPAEYLVRQSLTSGTRYVTALLKEHEARILGAQDTLAQLEADVFRRVVAEVAVYVKALGDAAAAVAFVDVVTALAEVASSSGYVRPVVDDSLAIEIAGGRHPTLETLLPPGEFVPNDATLDDNEHQITILTGPNMAGKSSWLRQTALIVLLAQIGSFVPATSARIGLVDRIFTRIGAQDDIASGQSTFMVEMLETANVLHHATRRSLVLLDEIGRGTSTWDGLAIARGVIEHLHNAPQLGCRTLFATHYHEVTELADILPGVCCARMDVLEDGDRVVFLHHVVPGATDRSYGIHVAEIAGVPRALTRRAREILSELERSPKVQVERQRRRVATASSGEVSIQLTYFGAPSQVVTAVRAMDVESLSPLEALTKLYELKRLAEDESSAGG